MKQFFLLLKSCIKKNHKEEINNIDCGTKETKQDLILMEFHKAIKRENSRTQFNSISKKNIILQPRIIEFTLFYDRTAIKKLTKT